LRELKKQLDNITDDFQHVEIEEIISIDDGNELFVDYFHIERTDELNFGLFTMQEE